MEDRVAWLTVEGPLPGDESIPVTDRWLSRPGEYEGYIADVRKMKTAQAMDKNRIEDRRKRNRTGKAGAILVEDAFMGFMA